MKIPKRIEPVAFSDEVIIASAATYAKTIVACGEGLLPGNAGDVPEHGSSFKIPLLIPEETETGDNREFEYNALTSRDFPLPLYWQIMTDEGHKGSVIVGRIDFAERVGEKTAPAPIDEADSVEDIVQIEDIPDGTVIEETAHATGTRGWGNAVGVFDSGPYGREAERLVRGGFLRGVSADLDKFEAAMELAADEEEDNDGNTVKNDKMRVTNARLMGATLLGKPAFQECTIELIEDEISMELPIEDGLYEEADNDPELLDAALIASAAPVVPPRQWLSNPKLDTLTPITVTDEGHVFGHIASWSSDHIGLPRGTKPPRSSSNYAYFRTGVLRTDDGSDVPVGQLTLAGGHASMSATAAQAVKHYDDTASAVADVAAGEDAFGIWVSGALRPDATPNQVRALRASAPSGDWRPINRRLELVAVCQVNVPGFPIARAVVAGGQIMALVAAGVRPIAELRESRVNNIDARLTAIETKELEAIRASALANVAPLKKESVDALLSVTEPARQALSLLQEESKRDLQIKADQARKMIFGD